MFEIFVSYKLFLPVLWMVSLINNHKLIFTKINTIHYSRYFYIFPSPLLFFLNNIHIENICKPPICIKANKKTVSLVENVGTVVSSIDIRKEIEVLLNNDTSEVVSDINTDKKIFY